VIENGRMWVREFTSTAPLDAIPRSTTRATATSSHELARRPAPSARRGRRVHVIAESHDNDRRLVLPASAGGLGLARFWSDDFHHALHRALTGETTGYYADFGADWHLERAIAEGFAFQGEPSEYWGRSRGTPSADLPATTS